MKAIWAIARRDIRSYFNTPIAYIVIGIFLGLNGYAFFNTLFVNDIASMRGFFDIVPLFMLVFAPLLTMRLLAEEKKSGTIEILLTLPVSHAQVVVGKFLAALMLLAIALVLTVPYSVSVAQLVPTGTQLDWGPVLGGYIGLLLYSSSMLAVGLWASSTTKNQVIAFVLGFLGCVGWFYIDSNANFARGLVESRDVIFYLSVTVGFLFLIEVQRHKIVTSAMVISLIFVNLIAKEYPVRIDLTRDHRYTLAQASRTVMRELSDVMAVTVYFTDDLPAPYDHHRRYLQDLLAEYRAVSNSRLSYEIIDPAANPDLLDTLPEIGVEPVQIRTIEDDREQSRRAYMAVRIQYKGGQEILPLIQDVNLLEQDLTLKMRKLVRAHVPVLAVLSDIPRSSIGRWRQMASDSVEITDDLKNGDALLIAGLTSQLDDKVVSEIERYLASGKGVALLLDRVSVDPETFQRGGRDLGASTALTKLLRSHGLSVGDEWVADAHCASLNSADGVLEYPLILQVPGLNPQSSLTHGLADLALPFCTPIMSDPKSVVLARSSKLSWIEHEPVNISPNRNWQDDDIVPTGPHALIVQVGERLVVAGTSALLWDPFFAGANAQFALNLVDWLVADHELLQMRARANIDVPIRDDLSTQTRALMKFGNIFGPSILLMLYGVVRWRRRASPTSPPSLRSGTSP